MYTPVSLIFSVLETTPDSNEAIADTILNIDPGAYEFCTDLFISGFKLSDV